MQYFNYTRAQFISIFGITFCILAIPLIAMQFTEEVNWGPIDFLAAGLIFVCCGLGILSAKKIKRKELRIAGMLLVIIIMLGIYAELAVGIL